MNAEEITRAFTDVFDQALVFHAFTDYMRDYQFIIQATADPVTGIRPAYLSYLFTNCVRATVTTELSPEGWADSLDERLIDHETGVDLDGYVWGVKWQSLYGGFHLLEKSAEAKKWSSKLGIPFYEAIVETNGHHVSMVFSDLRVTELERGYSPFKVGGFFGDGKIPFSAGPTSDT